MRKITVVSTDTQSRETFESEVNTVEELLTEFDERGIDYDGKALFEGISHTAIDTTIPGGILPHDNQYHGTVTNDLVIMITAGKKISSGAGEYDRKVLYNSIKELGLQQAIKERFGINYTNLGSGQLFEFIQEYCEKNDKKESKKAPVEQPVKTEQPSEEACINGCPAEEYFLVFLQFLIEQGIIHPFHVLQALENIGVLKIHKKDDGAGEVEMQSPYTDEEIDDMLAELNL